MRSPLLLALLSAVASAHFQLNYPPSRGDDDATQDRSPCGGLNKPSATRTRWPTTGGQLKFEAGHDEANTAVYLALGNDPKAADFTVIVRDKFLQIGLGTFCWNNLTLPADLTVKPGDNATIQVVQQGHTSGGLYNVCCPLRWPSVWRRLMASAVRRHNLQRLGGAPPDVCQRHWRLG